MKKLMLTFVLCFSVMGFLKPQVAQAYNFGDYTSAGMVTKAWGALGQGDIEAVLAYTNKTLELYSEEAKKMQASLTDYKSGDKDLIFAMWALNDVATALYIQGEAYSKANMIEEAKEAFNKLVTEYTYGQTWDPKGWFWKPAKAAQEKLRMLETGEEYDFGDSNSSFLLGQAWKSLGQDDSKGVVVYVDKILDIYSDEAKKMQVSLTEYPWESNEKIFEYWALNDVGTALFVKGEALRKAGDKEGAKEAYELLVNDYFFAQCWDTKGWFWKPAEAAQQALDELEG